MYITKALKYKSTQQRFRQDRKYQGIATAGRLGVAIQGIMTINNDSILVDAETPGSHPYFLIDFTCTGHMSGAYMGLVLTDGETWQWVAEVISHRSPRMGAVCLVPSDVDREGSTLGLLDQDIIRSAISAYVKNL